MRTNEKIILGNLLSAVAADPPAVYFACKRGMVRRYERIIHGGAVIWEEAEQGGSWSIRKICRRNLKCFFLK